MPIFPGKNAAIFVGGLGLHGYKQVQGTQERRIAENEYNMAVALWEFAGLVKTQIDDARRKGTGVLDFTKITIPSSQWYKVTLELIGTYFRLYSVPIKYARTGRLSFLTDNTL